LIQTTRGKGGVLGETAGRKQYRDMGGKLNMRETGGVKGNRFRKGIEAVEKEIEKRFQKTGEPQQQPGKKIDNDWEARV